MKFFNQFKLCILNGKRSTLESQCRIQDPPFHPSYKVPEHSFLSWSIIGICESCTNGCDEMVNKKELNWVFKNRVDNTLPTLISPFLFNLYINDLAFEIKQLNIRIIISGECVSILMYADDICLLASSERDLQEMLHVFKSWCDKQHMSLNKDKTQKNTYFSFTYTVSQQNSVCF